MRNTKDPKKLKQQKPTKLQEKLLRIRKKYRFIRNIITTSNG